MLRGPLKFPLGQQNPPLEYGFKGYFLMTLQFQKHLNKGKGHCNNM